MELFYCDACGLRIKSGDGLKSAEGARYCEPCYAKQFPNSAPPRAVTPAPGSQRTTAVFPNPTESSARRRPPSRQEATRGGTNSQTVMIGMAGGGVAALLLLGFLVFGRGSRDASVAATSKDETVREVARPAEAARKEMSTGSQLDKASNSKPVATAAALTPSATPPAPPQGPSQGASPPPTAQPAKGGSGAEPQADKQVQQGADKQAEFRESYARRQLDELLALELRGGVKPAELRKRVSELTKSHANTEAGREAGEKLKLLTEAALAEEADVEQKRRAVTSPVPDPRAISPTEQAQVLLGGELPVAGAGETPGALGVPLEATGRAQTGGTRVLWQNDFNSEAQWAGVEGAKETLTGSGGLGVKTEAKSGGGFVGSLALQFAKAGTPVKLGASSWVKFSYRLKGSADFCFHANIGAHAYERFLFGPKVGKWTKATFRLNEFTKCITLKNESQPAPHAELKGLTLLLSSSGGPATVTIDDVVIGDGPIPED